MNHLNNHSLPHRTHTDNHTSDIWSQYINKQIFLHVYYCCSNSYFPLQFAGFYDCGPLTFVWVQGYVRSAQGHEARHRQHDLWGYYNFPVSITFWLICRNCWVLKHLEWLFRSGIAGFRGKNWECQHRPVRRFDIQVLDRINILFSWSNAGGRELRNLPGKDSNNSMLFETVIL